MAKRAAWYDAEDDVDGPNWNPFKKAHPPNLHTTELDDEIYNRHRPRRAVPLPLYNTESDEAEPRPSSGHSITISNPASVGPSVGHSKPPSITPSIFSSTGPSSHPGLVPLALAHKITKRPKDQFSFHRAVAQSGLLSATPVGVSWSRVKRPTTVSVVEFRIRQMQKAEEGALKEQRELHVDNEYHVWGPGWIPSENRESLSKSLTEFLTSKVRRRVE